MLITWNAYRQQNCIFLCILQNKLHEPLYFRVEWYCVGGAAHGFESPDLSPSIWLLFTWASCRSLHSKNKTYWCTHDDHRKEIVLICEHALCSELLFSVSFCRYAQEPGAAPSPPSLIHLVSECDTHPVVIIFALIPLLIIIHAILFYNVYSPTTD